jgi:methanogenic corrinoid protein MtbC1
VHDVDRLLDLVESDLPHRAVELALARVRDGERVTDVVRHLLAPAQREVGLRWHVGRYTVAQEHAASAVIDDVLGLLTMHLAPPAGEHQLVLACAEGEWHTTPARMAALCFRDAGWRVRFLGGSMPADHLERALADLRPSAVAISCTLPLALAGVRTLADAAHRQGIPVVAGGAAVVAGEGRADRLGVESHAADPVDAAAQVRGWLDAPPPLRASVVDPDADDERIVLLARGPEIVDDAYAELEAALPVMARYDDRQRQHTREDLASILRFLDAALLVDDPGLFGEFVVWLRDLLAARGVPAAVLARTLDAVHGAVGGDVPRARRLLREARASLEG